MIESLFPLAARVVDVRCRRQRPEGGAVEGAAQPPPLLRSSFRTVVGEGRWQRSHSDAGRSRHKVQRRAACAGSTACAPAQPSPAQVDITLLCQGGAKRSPRRGPDRGRSDNARYRTGQASDVTGPFEADRSQHSVARAGRGACSPGCPGEERSDEGRPPPPLGPGVRSGQQGPHWQEPASGPLSAPSQASVRGPPAGGGRAS